MSNLILTSRINDTVYIGDDIKVTVLEVRGSQVRISYDVPEEISVDREKIRMRKLESRNNGN